MDKKIVLMLFSELKECQDFINCFCKEKVVTRKEIQPISDKTKKINFFVFLEYECD